MAARAGRVTAVRARAFRKGHRMRGPGYKLTLDVRRLWRCPACGYERRCNGRLTTVRCRCSNGVFMQLVSEPRFERKMNQPVDPYVDAEALLGPAEPVSGAGAASLEVETPPADATNREVAESNSTPVESMAKSPGASTSGEGASSPRHGENAGTGERPAAPGKSSQRSGPDRGQTANSSPGESSQKPDRPRRRRRGRGPRGPRPPGQGQ